MLEIFIFLMTVLHCKAFCWILTAVALKCLEIFLEVLTTIFSVNIDSYLSLK